MSDFKLDLLISADTSPLAKGLAEAERQMVATSKRLQKVLAAVEGQGFYDPMGPGGKKAQANAEKTGSLVGKRVLGGLGTALTAGAIVGVVTKAFAGAESAMERDSEFAGLSMGAKLGAGIVKSVTEVLNNLPIAGPLGRAVASAFGAFDFENLQADRLAKQEEVLRAQNRLNKELAAEEEIRKANLEAQAEAKRRSDEIGQAWIDYQNERIKRSEELIRIEERIGGDREYELLQRFLRAQNAGHEDNLRQLEREEELRRLMVDYNRKIQDAERQMDIGHARLLTRQRDYLAERLKQVHAAEEETRLLEEQAQLTEKRAEAEKVYAKARAEAERAVAGATASVSTAVGTFTTGAQATVVEAKIANKLSEEQRDLLKEIVVNTSGGVEGGGFA